MRFGTASTGPGEDGEDIELPKYFIKLQQTAPTGPGENIELPKYFIKLQQTAPTGPAENIELPVFKSNQSFFEKKT